jgi:hypothetical protein
MFDTNINTIGNDHHCVIDNLTTLKSIFYIVFFSMKISIEWLRYSITHSTLLRLKSVFYMGIAINNRLYRPRTAVCTPSFLDW